jgi:hypothetical protein
MTMKKLDPVFAATATLIDTDAQLEDWVEKGYVDEGVWCEGLNKVFNRIETAINDNVDEGPAAPVTTPMDFVKGFFSDTNSQVFTTQDHSVSIDPASAAFMTDASLAIIEGKKKIVCITSDGSDNFNIQVIDLETNTLDSSFTISTAGTLTAIGGLATGSGQQWWPDAICCDEAYAYILWNEDNASPEEYYVQSYSLADWSVNTSWPAYGCQLSDAEQLSLNPAQLKIANEDFLMVSQPWVEIAAGTDAGVAIIDKETGVVEGSGAGDTSFSSGGSVGYTCSNGTYVFFAVVDATSVEICSMPIATPGATGCGGDYWPYSLSVNGRDYLTGLLCAGGTVVASYSNTYVATVHFVDNCAGCFVTTADNHILERLYGIATDGVNIWGVGYRDITGGTTPTSAIFRLDFLHSYADYAAGPERPEEIVIGTSYGDNLVKTFRLETAGVDVIGGSQRWMAFDGADLWIDISFTGDSIYRLRKALLR